MSAPVDVLLDWHSLTSEQGGPGFCGVHLVETTAEVAPLAFHATRPGPRLAAVGSPPLDAR